MNVIITDLPSRIWNGTRLWSASYVGAFIPVIIVLIIVARQVSRIGGVRLLVLDRKMLARIRRVEQVLFTWSTTNTG